jgi:hypothetical protein
MIEGSLECVSPFSGSNPNTFGLDEMDEVGQVAGTAKEAGPMLLLRRL